MGPLILPPRGPVYIDTQIVVYSVDKEPTFAPRIEPLWLAVQAGRIEVVTSELTILECLVLPFRSGDRARQAAYEAFIDGPAVRLIPVDRGTLVDAARLRASVGRLRTPDSIHAATAVRAGCSMLLTNDAGLRGVPGVSTTYLGDVTP